MKSAIILFLATLILASCAVAPTTYTPPSDASVAASKYTVILDKSFNEAWAALISHAASSFFAIDQFEKDSGLMTLSFGSSNPAQFVDCGYWNVQNGYSGNYASYMHRTFDATLSGKMNILVNEIDDHTSEVRVNARYILSASPNTWSFDTGSSDSENVGTQAAYGTSSSIRTCIPTYDAENSILEAMMK